MEEKKTLHKKGIPAQCHYQKDVDYTHKRKSMRSKVLFNNYFQVPVHLSVICCSPKCKMPPIPGSPSFNRRRIASLRKSLELSHQISSSCLKAQNYQNQNILDWKPQMPSDLLLTPGNPVTAPQLHIIYTIPTDGMGIKFRGLG